MLPILSDLGFDPLRAGASVFEVGAFAAPLAPRKVSQPANRKAPNEAAKVLELGATFLDNLVMAPLVPCQEVRIGR